MSTTVDYEVEIEVEAADGHVQFVPLVPCVVFITGPDTYTSLFEDYMISLGCEPWECGEDPQMCECEIDWTCPLCKAAGRFGGYTWIETRYDGMED